jgi:hypothetical protein
MKLLSVIKKGEKEKMLHKKSEHEKKEMNKSSDKINDEKSVESETKKYDETREYIFHYGNHSYDEKTNKHK